MPRYVLEIDLDYVDEHTNPEALDSLVEHVARDGHVDGWAVRQDWPANKSTVRVVDRHFMDIERPGETIMKEDLRYPSRCQNGPDCPCGGVGPLKEDLR